MLRDGDSQLFDKYELILAVEGVNGNKYQKTVFSPALPYKNKLDVFHKLQYKVMTVERKTHEAAVRFGRKYGNVISCTKIDPTRYLHQIENIKLPPMKPITVELIDSSVVVDKSLELQKKEPKKTYTIDIE
jgi:hypothetical protein